MTTLTLENGAFVVPPEGGQGLWLMGHYCDVKAKSTDTRHSYSLVDVTLAPDLGGPPPHLHDDREEAYYVLEGTLRVLVGQEYLNLEPGAFCFVPRGTVHAFVNGGKVPARMVVISSPGGDEGFFESIGEPAQYRGLPPKPSGPPDFEKMKSAAREYNMEIITGQGGPPPS